MSDKQELQGVRVEGIVAASNKEPYVVLRVNRERVQMEMATARNVAHDILRMCSRTEADAMLVRFFAKMEFPDAALAALMVEFRTFRLEIDKQSVDREWGQPTEGEATKQ